MKLIAWWMGSDSLCLVTNPPGNRIWHIKLFFYRLKWKLIHKYFDHWVDHENLIPHLIKFGIPKNRISVQIDKPNYVRPVRKVNHHGFNILYYMPTKSANLGGQKFLKWVYGWDIYVNLKGWFSDNHNIRFVWVNGHNDMTSIYPTIDLYIRPTRNDGCGRMIMECDINNIPYIFSRDGKPTVDDFIKQIQQEYEKNKK